jgi:hypothetical protein
MLVLQFNGEHGVGQRLDDRALDFDRILLCHRRRLSPSDRSGYNDRRAEGSEKPDRVTRQAAEVNPAERAV